MPSRAAENGASASDNETQAPRTEGGGARVREDDRFKVPGFVDEQLIENRLETDAFLKAFSVTLRRETR